MNRKSFKTFAVCVVAALALASAASAQAPAPKEDADRARAAALWEEAVRAKGGRERLHSIQSLLITSTVDARAPKGSNTKDAVRLYAMPGRVWVYTYTEQFDVKIDATVINTDRKLCTLTLAPARHGVSPLSRCLPETMTQYLLQDPFIYLLETNWVRPVPVRARAEGEGRKRVDVIETEVGNLRADFYLDPKTKLPFKVVTEWYGGIGRATGTLGPMEVKLEDYEEVEGVLMPRRVTRRLLSIESPVGGPPNGHTERARYRFNVTYDPSIFDAPIPKRVKPDDWKPRRDS